MAVASLSVLTARTKRTAIGKSDWAIVRPFERDAQCPHTTQPLSQRCGEWAPREEHSAASRSICSLWFSNIFTMSSAAMK